MKKITSIFTVLAIILTQMAFVSTVSAADISSDGSYTLAYELIENGDDDYLQITGFSIYPGAEYVLTIPASADYNGTTYPVRAIADNAFSVGCTSTDTTQTVTYKNSTGLYNDLLKGVVFEGTNLQSIGANAFAYCSNTSFTELTIPDSVTSVGKAFNYCTRLERLTLGEGLALLPFQAITQCNKLETLTIKADDFTFDKVGSIYVAKGMKNIVLESDSLTIAGPLLLFATKADEALSRCEGTGFTFKVNNTSVYDTLISAGYTADYVTYSVTGEPEIPDVEIDADISFYESKWRFDAWSTGGLDTVDTLQYARKNSHADISIDDETLASADIGNLPAYISDATSDLIGNKEFAFTNSGKKISLDVKFNSSYSDSVRQTDNLLIMLNRADDSNKSGTYTVELSYSTTSAPDTFISVYTGTISVTQDYAYFSAKNIKNITGVDTLRFSVTYSGSTFSISEIDVNMKDDPYTAARQAYYNQIKPVKVIADGMVMQRNVANTIWGTGGVEGKNLTVTIGSQTKTATVENGKWSVDIDPMEAGGPYEMTIACEGTDTVTVSDIWFGEVWLAGGQSNMARSFKTLLGEIDDRDVYYGIDKDKLKAKIQDAVDTASDENTRFCVVNTTATSVPYYDVRLSRNWLAVNSTNVIDMSAVCYYFAQEMREEFGPDMPIGIVVAPVPGSPLQGWVSNELIASDPDYAKYDDNWTDAMYYNSMIYPLADYNFKGVLWYQGESNVSDVANHEKMFPQMIQLWRELFDDPDMPFIFTQLAPYTSDEDYSRDLLRETQLYTMLNVPNTAMAVITDSGDPYNIHPMDKSRVGIRLAAAVKALAYGGAEEYSGPLYKSMKVSGNKLILSFDHVGSGLTIGTDWGEDVGLEIGADGVLTGFEISADGAAFVPATAVISGNNVIVSAEGIDMPVAVRYGWQTDYYVSNSVLIRDTVIPTLYNNEGFPAVPFRAYADGFAFDVEYTEGDSAALKIDYTNKNTINSVFLVAVFYNGKLVSTKALPAKFDYDGTAFSTTYNVDLSSYEDRAKVSIKVFAFDGLNSAKPLAESRSLAVQN